MRRPRSLSFLVLVSLWASVPFPFSSPALAQETTAGVHGYVRDQTKAFVAGASVVISGTGLLQPRTTISDTGGYFRFDQLPPGTYRLEVTARGFRVWIQNDIQLSVGRLPLFNVGLQIGIATERVEVSSRDVPMVDVTTSHSGLTVPQRVIDKITSARQFYSLIGMAPGARADVLQGGFQIDGASDGENVYLVEGLDTTDMLKAGVSRLDRSYMLDFVNEVQIRTSGLEAEYGGAIGGVVNVIQRRGGNAWHGSVFTYYQGDAITASNPPTLRRNPLSPNNYRARISGAAEYYQPKQDRWHTLETGFTAGGYLLRNKLWLFAGYDPQRNVIDRTVNMSNQAIAANNGPHTFTQETTTHSAQARLDASVRSNLHLFGSWVYAYQRINGVNMPAADSSYDQYNASSVKDVSLYPREQGEVLPTSLWLVGGDWQIKPSFLVTARYGQHYEGFSDRSKASGLRYSAYMASLVTTGFDGTPIPESLQLTPGWSNIPSTYQVKASNTRRDQMSVNAAYFRSFAGTHNLKFGYDNSRRRYYRDEGLAGGPLVALDEGELYMPTTDMGISACMAISGTPACAGNYGFYTVQWWGNYIDAARYQHAFYFQDAWTLKLGLTLNVGMRFEHETVPRAISGGPPKITFGWGEKIAPRIGAAYDVLHNGKWKIYGSYGRFYDVMKDDIIYAFGSLYAWGCTYTLDSPDYTLIKPQQNGNKWCPGGGLPGTLIESPQSEPSDLPVDPKLKPMQQHEHILGTQLAISDTLGLEVRYARKRLDYAIEDQGITTGNYDVYFIGNAGYGQSSHLLNGAIDVPGTNITMPPLCATCPSTPGASRRYDGISFYLTTRPTRGWFGQVSYTYSKLAGNFPGLSTTYSWDQVGRHDPYFLLSYDGPIMEFDSKGAAIDGPLPTDRPHTLQLAGAYTLKWLKRFETSLGLTQVVFSGGPVSTVWRTAGGFQMVSGQDNWVNLHRDSTTGDFVSDGITQDRRTAAFTQTDLQFSHEYHVSGKRENMSLKFTFGVMNVLNQRAVMGLQGSPLASGHADPYVDGVVANGYDWMAFTKTGWDYIAATNSSKLTLLSTYGMANVFQPSRQAFLGLHFTF